MNPIYDFKGQVALVTGAAKGMGLVTARMFAESGAAVVLADLDGALAAVEAERMSARAAPRSALLVMWPPRRRWPQWSTARSQSMVGSTWPLTMPASRCPRPMRQTN